MEKKDPIKDGEFESYLRIKDTSEFGYIEENSNPNDFSF